MRKKLICLLVAGSLPGFAMADATSDQIKGELSTGFPYRHPILEFPEAGHGIGSLVPYINWFEPMNIQGKNPNSDQLAREQAWPEFLTFLNAIAAR